MREAAGQDERSLRWWQFVGPWPLSPVAVASSAWLTAGMLDIARLTTTEPPLDVWRYPPFFVFGLPAAIAAWFVMWLFARAQRNGRRRSAWLYWGAIAAAAGTFVAVRFAMGLPLLGALNSDPQIVIAGLVRTIAIMLIIEMATGITGHRLLLQVDKTNMALELVREQQQQMLEADERMRAQVSTLLHDRVQAGLIAACLELQDAADRVDPAVRREIADVVHRLEGLRGLDVRRAARTLSPNLDDTDLHSAIDDLASQYAPAMHVDVTVAPSILSHAARPSERLLLGAYRIIEQSLLNAAVHGRARNCRVHVDVTDAEIVVVIDDDGVGMPNGASPPGLGTALMTTWVWILDGHLARTVSSMGGVRVRASLPLERA